MIQYFSNDTDKLGDNSEHLYRVSRRLVLNFKIIFLMTYHKKTRFAIKTKIEKLSLGHLDIC